MLKKAACVNLKCLQPIRKRSKLESDLRCHETHLLIVQSPLGTDHRYRQQDAFLATQKVS